MFDYRYFVFLIHNLYFFLLQTEERVTQAGDSQGPGSVALLQASEESSPFYLSLCVDCNVCKGSTWTARTDMKKERDHCDYECCKNKTSP